MNRSPIRTQCSGHRVVSRRESAELETMDTALTSRRTLRLSLSHTRATLSVLASLGLLAGVALTSHAQEKPTTDKDAAPKVTTTKDAKPTKAAKTAKLDALHTDIPRFTLLARAPKQDATPADAKPKQPDAVAAAPAPGSVSYSGLVDVYFAVNTRAPRSALNGPFATAVTPDGTNLSIDNAGRSFDVNDRDPTLSLAELNIVRTPNKSLPIGITATLTLGETARLVHATEPGGTSAWSFLQQLYLTYTAHALKRDIAIDFGEFVTPFGYEVIESVNNDNYSRGFNFQYGVPLYHAGLRVTVPVTSTITAIAGLVNGWNNIADDNNSKSVFGQLTWKPNAKITGILGYMGGAEGTGAYGFLIPKDQGNITTQLFDAQGIYQLSAKTKLAANVTYGQGYGDVSGAAITSGTWLGVAAYARHQFTPIIAGTIRVEQFEDTNGLRTGFAGYTKLNEVTLTGEYITLRGHLVARLEYRHDHANQTLFGAGSGGTTPDQDTISLSGAYKF